MFMRTIRPAVSLLVLMTVLLGIVYPLVITGVGESALPAQADGSLIYRDGKLVGSTFIGQSFSDPKYFWGRPSATTPQPYNGLASGGFEPGSAQSRVARSGQGERQGAARGRSATTGSRFRSTS